MTETTTTLGGEPANATPPTTPPITPPDTGPAPPSKADVLATLDWEIQTASDEGKAVGTSTWSLAFALGAVLWLLSSQAEYSWSQLPPLIHLTVGFYLVYDLLSWLYTAAGAKLPDQQPRRVFSPSSQVGPLRRQLVFQLLCRGSLAGLVFAGSDPFLTPFVRWVVGMWFGFGAGILLLGLLLGTLTFEIADKPRKRKLEEYLLSLNWIGALAVTIVFWVPGLQREDIFRAVDYRSAALVVVSLFLVDLLLSSLRRSMLLPFLIVLRRDLALGVIGPDEAATRARHTLSGLTVDEFVKREFDAHRALLTRGAGLFARINSYLDAIEKGLVSSPDRDPEKYLADCEKVVDFGAKFDNSDRTFRTKIEALPEGEMRTTLGAQADQLLEEIRKQRSEATTRIARVREGRRNRQEMAPPPGDTTTGA